MIARRQRVMGGANGSHFLVIPASTVIAKEATVAVGRLMLADTTGRIDEKELARIMEEVIEPCVYKLTSK